MKPKPTKSKAKLNPPRDIHRGFELIGSGSHWQVFSTATGAELWDSGFPSRELAVSMIDALLDD